MTVPAELAPDDSRVLQLLEDYLTELHAGRRPDRARWLADHPELAPHFDCLDRLERLAPPLESSTLPAEPPTLAPSAEGPPDLTGEVVAEGKYELLGEIGRGGMGVVYRARQIDLDRVVALKMILAGSMASEEQHRRFHEEARIAARLQHPHVIQVYETGHVNGLPYVALQYVDGCSLAQRCRRQPLPIDDAVRCLAAVARAVDHLHQHGIIHRDIKPSNILIDADGRPYVTDFGLAKLVEGDSGMTQSGAVLGTPSYMAPEQAGGARTAGPAADVYSLGAVLYELLTGRPPFQAGSPLDTLLLVIEGEPEPPRRLNPRVPRVLEQVCLQCLDKNPERRYPSAAALAEALECYLRGEAVPVRRAGPVENLVRWARREPALASRLAALAAFSGIIWFKFFAQDYEPVLSFQVQAVLLTWAAVSLACQQGLRRPRWANAAGYVWSAADVLMMVVIMLMTDALVSPLVIGYPFLVAASGLWSRLRMVWFTTACTIVGYAGLVWHERLTSPEPALLHRHLIFVIALAVLGFIMAYQVERVRALSRYYEGPGERGA